MVKIDFGALSQDDLDQYVMGTLVFDDGELLPILRGHLLIERMLEALLGRQIPYPERFFDSRNVSFDVKLHLANAMGCLPEAHFAAAKALNRIRNKYAHNTEFQVAEDDLKVLQFDFVDIQYKALKVAKDRGLGDHVQITVIFLCWAFQRLLHPTS